MQHPNIKIIFYGGPEKPNAKTTLNTNAAKDTKKESFVISSLYPSNDFASLCLKYGLPFTPQKIILLNIAKKLFANLRTAF